MKAGEKDRVGRLRLVLSELQKAAKEGGDDELAVLRRERKRRLDAADAVPRRAAATSSPRPRRAEAELIEGYLPAELSDDELRAIVVRGRGRSRATLAAGHGRGDEGGRWRRRRPRRRQARVGAGAGGAAGLMRASSSSPTRSPPRSAGSKDPILRALEGHVDCEVFLRGNVVTLDGERRGGRGGRRRSCASSPSSSRHGHEISPGTIGAVTDALDRSTSRRPRCSRTSSGATARRRSRPRRVNQKRYVDSIRSNTITFGIGPAGTGKTFLAVAMAAAALVPARGQPDHPHPPRGRGRRAAGLPARRPDGQDRPLPAAAVRRAARHARPREGRRPPRAQGRSRSRRWPSCAGAR